MRRHVRELGLQPFDLGLNELGRGRQPAHGRQQARGEQVRIGEQGVHGGDLRWEGCGWGTYPQVRRRGRPAQAQRRHAEPGRQSHPTRHAETGPVHPRTETRREAHAHGEDHA
eukprot:scaffold10193_cov107-Isochrysis_galbana.AAC.1